MDLNEKRLDKLEQEVAHQGAQLASVATKVDGISASLSSFGEKIDSLSATTGATQAGKGMISISHIFAAISILLASLGTASAVVMFADRSSAALDAEKLRGIQHQVDENAHELDIRWNRYFPFLEAWGAFVARVEELEKKTEKAEGEIASLHGRVTEGHTREAEHSIEIQSLRSDLEEVQSEQKRRTERVYSDDPFK